MKKTMTKDDVTLLIQLVQKQPILTSKETNAFTNKLKEEAWSTLTDYYNAINGKIPRNKEQLKFKWDNLKKAARKRTQQMRMNQLESGGENEFIPPNDNLEMVAAMLGNTSSGFETPIGGDGSSQENTECVYFPSLGLDLGIDQVKEGICEVEVDQQNEEVVDKQTSTNELLQKEKSSYPKKAKMGKDDGRKERNMAIAEYFREKTKKVVKEQEKLQLEIDLLKQLKDKNKK